MRSDLVELVVELQRETDKAVLVSDDGEPVWFPRSQVEIERTDAGKAWVLTRSRRLAQEGELREGGWRMRSSRRSAPSAPTESRRTAPSPAPAPASIRLPAPEETR